jgi:hypothetical protein
LNKSNDWITTGIKTSCKHKSELYIACRNSKNYKLRDHYNKYCKILSRVIKEAEKLKYESKIQNSNNKNKTVWDFIKLETSKGLNNEGISVLKLMGKRLEKKRTIAETFNEYFLSVPENRKEISKQNNISPSKFPKITPNYYLLQTFLTPFQV